MYIQNSENEDNKNFLKIKSKKNRNKKIEFEEIKENEYICVEIPGKIKKRSKGLSAVESLGGLNKITSIFNFHKNKCKYDENLILRINNNDMFSSFISANWTKVNNILIKIKKTRKNKYKFECLGVVKYIYYFDNMSDFYYIPSFYNRYDYNINYIHYLTKGNKKKKQKQKSCNDNFENNPINKYDPNISNIDDYQNDSFFYFQNNQINKENCSSISSINKVAKDKSIITDMHFNCSINNEVATNMNGINLNNSEINTNIEKNTSIYNNSNMQNKIYIQGNMKLETNKYIHNENNHNYFCEKSPYKVNHRITYDDNNNNNTDIHFNEKNKYLDDISKCASYNDQLDQIKDIHKNQQKNSLNDMIEGHKNSELFSLDITNENDKEWVGDGIIGNKERDDQTTFHMDKWNEINKNRKNNNENMYSKNKEYANEVMNTHGNHNFNNILGYNENKINSIIHFDNIKQHPVNPLGGNFNYYISDMEDNEIFNKIINSKICSDMFEEKKEMNFSSDESEAYELHCCIHSKTVTPYDYKNYESITTNKYIRDFKYVISKFTASIDSKAEAKKGEIEKFIKELIINNNEKKNSNVLIELPKKVEVNERNKSLDEDNEINVTGNSLNNNIEEIKKHMQNKKNNESNSVDDIFLQKNKFTIDNNSIIDDEFNELKNISNTEDATCYNNKNNDSLNKYSNKIIVSKQTIHCNPIAKYDDLEFPSIPFDSAMKKYVSDKLYNKVKLLFDIRPIWSKDVLLEHLENISTYCLKSCFSKICFYFVDGPWRRTYCKYGYDPRKDPSSYMYQTIDFRDNFYKNIKTKNLEDINRCIKKKKSAIDNIVTDIIKKINNKTNVSTYDSNDNTKNTFFNNIQGEIKNQGNFKRDNNIYSEISSGNIGNNNNIENFNNFQSDLINTIYDDLSNNKDKQTVYSNNNNLNDGIFFHIDEEINDILQFLKRSKTFHLRQHFSAEVHFSVTPLKISTIFQFIDIYDNNVLNYLLNVKTQEVCSKDYGWLNSQDLAKIRDILFVRSVTLRHAHSK